MSRILVVDDNEPLRELLKEVLLENKHSVDSASDGKVAIQALRQRTYDLMLLDMHMPNMGGLDVLRLVKASPRLRSIKVIMLTSESLTKEVEAAFEAGAAGYILKPYNMEKLLAKVADALKTA